MTRWALIAIIALLGFPAAAQMACGMRPVVIQKLNLRYGETQRGFGPVGSAVVFEIWVSAETGSWTILRSTPNGLSCIVAVGQNWQEIPRKLPGKDS